jgi:coproporphyrinogen III oxidase-like Fe-S oxidoreductase
MLREPMRQGPAAAEAPGFGVYVHWPFCLSKCPYCDFNSHVRETVDAGAGPLSPSSTTTQARRRAAG